MNSPKPYVLHNQNPDALYPVAQIIVDQLYYDAPIQCSVDSSFEKLITIGSCVLLRTTNSPKHLSKEKLGFIFELTYSNDPVPTNYTICDIVDQGKPFFSETLAKLMLWISEYYACYSVEALYSAIPAGLRRRPKEFVRLKPFQLSNEPKKIVRTALRKRILSFLNQEPLLSIDQLKQRTGSDSLRETLVELEKANFIEVFTQFSQPLKPKTKIAYKPSYKFTDSDIRGFLEMHPRAKKQLAALEWMAENQPDHFILDDINASSETLNALIKKGYVEKTSIEVETQFAEPYESEKTHQSLNNEQLHAFSAIKEALKSGSFKSFLLFGITGSGKTTVYIEAIRQTLSEGKTAIMLVPEISLTPQTTARFKAFFGQDVRVLHSGLNTSEKVEAWNSLRSNKARIAIGARSAVFAPLTNVGLIIVDEEHELSYKQHESTPTYHARDVALMRAKFEHAVCILGSATPSFETYTNALHQKHALLTLTQRYNQTPLPKIKLLHLPKSEKKSAHISQPMYEAIKTTMDQGEQVILFINRRGFAGSILCNDCGFIKECDLCKVPMVYHLTQNALQCHYCGSVKPLLDTCPACSSANLAMQRGGTERLELELQTLFPEKRIQRMDLDTTRRKNAHSTILSRFNNQRIDILLGTQMVAKGLDFPNVALVGILLGDIGLTLPDFRATERLFALLTQAAGRSGRGQRQGEVFLQVLNPEHSVFKYVLLGDYKSFYAEEISAREELFYPPFSRLSKFEFSGDNLVAVEQAGAYFKNVLINLLPNDGYQCLGPAPAVLQFLKGRYRYHLLLKQHTGFRLKKEWVRLAIREFRVKHKQFKTVTIRLDIDALSML